MAFLSLITLAAAAAPRAAAMMRPNLQAQQQQQRQPESLVAELVGESTGTAARKTCAPQYDYLQPASADPVALLQTSRGLDAKAHGSDSHGREGTSLRNHSYVRPCAESISPVGELKALVLPEYKLAFCYIPKVGATDFKSLFNKINGLSDRTVGFGHSYYASFYYNQDVNLSSMTKENGWKFAIFTRDPALRYLSAYGDTCIVKKRYSRINDHTWSCCGQLVPQNESLEIQVERFKQRLTMDLLMGRPGDEQHWSQQTEVLQSCGWDLFKPENIDYWGTLSGDVHTQVKEMLQMVHYTNDTLLERFFPEDHIAGHTGLLSGEPSDYINDLETLEGLIKLYEDDYRNLPGVGCGFTEPLLAKLRAASNGTSSA